MPSIARLAVSLACVLLTATSSLALPLTPCARLDPLTGEPREGARIKLRTACRDRELAVPKDAFGISSGPALRSFDGSFGSTSLLGNDGKSLAFPTACRSQSYLAKDGDMAVFRVQFTGWTPANNDHVLTLSPVVAVDGGPFLPMNVGYAAGRFYDHASTAVGTVASVPLVAGKWYLFGVGIGSNLAMTLGGGACQGTIRILRNPA